VWRLEAPEETQLWELIAERASDHAGTPCYAIAETVIDARLKLLHALMSETKLRHWLSMKTQPVPHLINKVIKNGMGVEVVSEFELRALLDAGISSDQLLVNGVNKHKWLRNISVRNLRVHFDSLAEVKALAPASRALNWKVGLRCAIPGNLREGEAWDQFGMVPLELKEASTLLRREGVPILGLHFHLHTNVKNVSEFSDALKVAVCAADSAQLSPEYLDIGGGLPVSGEEDLDGSAAAYTFSLRSFRDFLSSVPNAIPSVQEIWLENGRFLSGPAGALVITVLDLKERGNCRYLICDGGRVNHARMASIESHGVLVVPARGGENVKTVICGPTCSAVDRLGSWDLPKSVRPGDRIVWMSAGAYHIPLETRFSLGLAPVIWFNTRNEPEIVRHRETPRQWWCQWSETHAPSREVRWR
jgi:diaminopimelate decarboxylase